MIIEEEVIKQGINWFALIIAIIFFLILTRPSVIKQLESLEKSKPIYIISLLLSSGIYFLIDYVK